MYTSTIIEMIPETEDTKTLRFEKPQGFKYMPGHYGIFEFTANGEIIRRSYSISSSPTEEFMQITVKHIPNGKMSSYLTGLKPGDKLTFNAPIGKFTFDDGLKEVVFVAGGSGISVFRAMIKYIFDKKLSIKSTLIYGSRSPKDIIMWDWLEKMNKENSDFRLFLTVDKGSEEWHRHVGFINAEFIKEATMGQPVGKVYFLCGPPVMVTSVRDALLKLGVPEPDIRLDAWG